MTTKQLQLSQLNFTMAHDTYSKGLSNYAYYKVSNYEKSEDLVQETFLKTWKYIIRGGEINTMKAFLYHILNGLIIDDYRKKKNLSLDVLIEKGFEPHIEYNDIFLNNYDSKIASVLICRLSEKYQKILKMRYIQDLSLAEISEITGQTKNTIAVQVNRGLEKIRLLNHSYCEFK